MLAESGVGGECECQRRVDSRVSDLSGLMGSRGRQSISPSPLFFFCSSHRCVLCTYTRHDTHVKLFVIAQEQDPFATFRMVNLFNNFVARESEQSRHYPASNMPDRVRFMSRLITRWPSPDIPCHRLDLERENFHPSMNQNLMEGMSPYQLISTLPSH